MPTISGLTSLAALTGTNANVFLGSQYELAPFDGTIEIGIKSNRLNVTCSIFSGPDVLQEPGGFVPVGPTLGTVANPVYPDDFLWEDEVAQGDRLKLALTNVDAAIALVAWALRITPA